MIKHTFCGAQTLKEFLLVLFGTEAEEIVSAKL